MTADKIIAEINTNGYTIIAADGKGYLPSVAYTVGLHQAYSHPEIILFGLTVHNMKCILAEVAEKVKNGEKWNTAKCYHDLFDNGHAEFLSVHDQNIKDYFIDISGITHAENLKALQLVWSDGKKNFPWHDDFDREFVWKQPLLDRNAGFKFREAKDLEVLVASDAIDHNKPIVHVIHEHHGKWQFLTGDIPEKMKLLSLEKLVALDETLNEVYDLEYGEAAERETRSGDWIKYKIEIPDEE